MKSIKSRLSDNTVYTNIPINNKKEENLKNVINTLLSEIVSDKLTSVFPECKWSWQDNSPSSFIENGETVVLTKNADGYNHATISINEDRLNLLMVKATSLDELKQEKNFTKPIEQTEDIDIYSWFTNIGQQKLREIISDLDTKNCNEFKIKEDGSVFIYENDKKIRTATINSIPPKNQWNSIIPLVEDIGYLGYIKDNELIINF